jgi:hypothetical protein
MRVRVPVLAYARRDRGAGTMAEEDLRIKATPEELMKAVVKPRRIPKR